MEELKEALSGKSNEERNVPHAYSFDMSTDSLEIIVSENPKQSIKGKIDASTNFTEEKKKSFYINENMRREESPTLSNMSIQSDPIQYSKSKNDFIQSAMSDYLNSHRHSLSSVMELIDLPDRNRSGSGHCKYESLSDINYEYKGDQEDDHEIKHEYNLVDNDVEIYEQSEPNESMEPYYILSPIEEKSEPSTRSSSFRGSNGSDKRRHNHDGNLTKLSNSCNAIPREYDNSSYYPEKCQTFPRVKNELGSNNPYKNYYNENTMYPLEPRELDPSAFFQLHTADSQEELQEFLLLESECMNDNRSRGLATAFLPKVGDLGSNFSLTKGNLTRIV